jgi:hypothetical protein
VLLTGFDDVQLARHLVPPLTTVHQPMRQLGLVAVELLLRRIDDPNAEPKAVELPTYLVVRRSCGCQLTELAHHHDHGIPEGDQVGRRGDAQAPLDDDHHAPKG